MQITVISGVLHSLVQTGFAKNFEVQKLGKKSTLTAGEVVSIHYIDNHLEL